LSTLGYSAIDTVEVTNSFEGDVPDWDDAPTSIPQLFGSAAGHAALRAADALSRFLRRARAVRHLKLEDDGFDEEDSPDVRPPGTVLFFCLVARAAAPLPLARLVASAAAVAGLAGLALHPAREHLRELEVYGLDPGDADQAAGVSAVLGTAAQRLTRLELYVMPWPPSEPGPGRLAALAQPLAWAAAAGPMPALRSLTVGCLLGAALAAAVAAQCPALTELVLHSATEVQSDGVGAAWAGPDKLPCLTAFAWCAFPATSDVDVTAEVVTIVAGRRLDSLWLRADDTNAVLPARRRGDGVCERFTLAVLAAMPCLPRRCKLDSTSMDASHLAALVYGTAKEVATVERVDIGVLKEPATLLAPLAQLVNLRHLELSLWYKRLVPEWVASLPALPRLEVLSMDTAEAPAALLASLAVSVMRASLRTLVLQRIQIAPTAAGSAGDVARLTSLRRLIVTWVRMDVDGIVPPYPSRAAEAAARDAFPRWTAATLPALTVQVLEPEIVLELGRVGGRPLVAPLETSPREYRGHRRSHLRRH